MQLLWCDAEWQNGRKQKSSSAKYMAQLKREKGIRGLHHIFVFQPCYRYVYKMRQTISNAMKSKCTKARSIKKKRLCTEFHYDKTEKSSEQANYIMNLPRPSSSGKLGAWTREGQQKVDDITNTHV